MKAVFDFIKETLENGYFDLQGYEAVKTRFIEDLGMTFKESEHYVLLDYSQIDSPRKHPVADVCRGLIMTKDMTKVVCRPFDRFYNYGEFPELEKEFDFSTAHTDEKADGSLIKAWFDPIAQCWQVGTRGSFFADNCISTLSGEEGTVSFRSLFLRALGATEEQMQELFGKCLNTENTYLFELCTLENKVVTSYPRDTVFLLAARNNESGSEFTPAELDELQEILNTVAKMHFIVGYPIERPKSHPLDNFESAVKASEQLGGLKEGFVIRDGQNRRMKIKSAAYVTAHHLRGEGVTPKRAVLLGLSGEIPEFLAYFPEYTELLKPYEDHIIKVKAQCLEAFEQHKHIEVQKDYALAIKGYPFNGYLFNMRKGQTLEQCIARSTENTLLAIFRP